MAHQLVLQSRILILPRDKGASLLPHAAPVAMRRRLRLSIQHHTYGAGEPLLQKPQTSSDLHSTKTCIMVVALRSATCLRPHERPDGSLVGDTIVEMLSRHSSA